MTDDRLDRANIDRAENVAGRSLAIISDLIDLSGFPVPGRAMLGRYLEAAVAKRRGIARDIRVEEMRAGVPLDAAMIAQIDESAAIILRYLRAADEGAHARNLRLLARAFRRQLGKGEADADRFHQTAASIDNLSDAELDLLGTWFAFDPEQNLNALRQQLGMEWEDADRQELYGTAASMLRNGLVIPGSAYGGMAFDLSPAARRLLRDLESADFRVPDAQTA